MPPLPAPRQTDPSHWYGSGPGRCVLDSQGNAIADAVAERPGQPWLWLAPVAAAVDMPPGRGLQLLAQGTGWNGAVRCALPLPLANESMATVLLQHVPFTGADSAELLDECARVLMAGARLWLFALNPLAPYRWRWQGTGLSAAEPMLWRRRLRKAGLVPEPISQGVGPRWQVRTSNELQQGPGLRAAYLLRAEKRAIPLTPIRQRAPLRIGGGVPAA